MLLYTNKYSIFKYNIVYSICKWRKYKKKCNR